MSFLVATLLRDLTCPANPPGVKRLPLQSTSLAHTQAGCQVQVAIPNMTLYKLLMVFAFRTLR
ncbi:hypothetical protein [Neobacillus jeddahensis]|uniref:hypothetical protein n=1 Tax=Neobacillus jeddahensis TaxID=1461580 RepID=UPI00058DFF7C|nr:hypothetical protein [Neobacillus jeddahensis]